ncbi:unnamed protein product [Taenia asiatica]|uniref:Aldo_ket_red domain-containing protein n=1 Tax=Taenia asiatica TaxID=60517 RepID=A0A0R3WD43_TAEAS|nr:unnamed protein product [Taenia asiatica]
MDNCGVESCLDKSSHIRLPGFLLSFSDGQIGLKRPQPRIHKPIAEQLPDGDDSVSTGRAMQPQHPACHRVRILLQLSSVCLCETFVYAFRLKGRLLPFPLQLRGDDLTTAINTALELGYRYYDCAHLYANEAEIRDHLGACIHSGRIAREDLFITSKLWNTFHRPELVRTACETSIKRLQVEYLDLYLIHWPVPYQPGDVMVPRDAAGNTQFDEVDLLDTWKAMEDLVALGLCRHIGVSNFNTNQLERILSNCRIPPAMLQIESNATFLNQPLIDFAHSRGIPVTAYYALGCPYLHFKRGISPLMEQPLILELAKKYGKTPAQIALRHGLQRGLCVIFKSKTPARLAENLQVFDFELSKEDMRRLEELGRGTRMLKGAA